MTSPAGRTVGEILENATRRLIEAGVPDARADALALFGHLLGTDRGGVVARRPETVDRAVAERMDALVAARAARRPLQQITGHVDFRGLDLFVDEHVLIPRPETEGLVDAVLEETLPAGARIADLGTGSGCVAVALAVARPGWRVDAVDVSSEALAVAERNAARHGVAGRVRTIEGDFARAAVGDAAPYDAVVSNPPYVPEDEWRGLQEEVRAHEPKLALVPGPTGHEAYAAVAAAAARMLLPGGLVALELGWTSEPAVREIVARHGFRAVRTRPDLQGIPRILTARRP